MEVDRPTLYRPMEGAWYRVLTHRGEIRERMQYRDGAFHDTTLFKDGTVRVIPLADVERVAVRPRPGFAGGADRFLVVNPSPAEPDKGWNTPVVATETARRRYICGTCGLGKTCATRGPTPAQCVACDQAALPARRYTNGKKDGTAGAAIMAAIREHGPLTTTEMRQRLPAYRDCTLKTAAVRMVRLGMLTRSTVVMSGHQPRLLYAIGEVEYTERARLERMPDTPDEPWTPGVWRNPIAAGTASKVQAAPWVPLDFSDPRRAA